jgi:D-alanyl-D-alanine carboxypeptidase
MRVKAAAWMVGAALVWTVCVSAPQTAIPATIDAYLTPYVSTNNFAGVVRVEENGKVVFQKAYGFAHRESNLPNRISTRFHVASMSMQFTAAAILRLADRGAIGLDSPISDVIPGTEWAGRITVRDLLTERSGLPDINELPDYQDILQHHQSPASLVGRIGGRPLLFEPGSKYLHEEHSAYNLLALIVETKTGLPFADAVERLVFRPLGLAASFVDDDSETRAPEVARGYQPQGVRDLEPASGIHWSAKAGNASVCTTAGDEARWVRMLFRGSALGESRSAVLDAAPRVGYGWFRGTDTRFNETAYYMNGRAPGYSSFVLYLPAERLTVVAFSNVYSSSTTSIGYDVASIVLGLPHGAFRPARLPLEPSALETSTGTFQFAADFYQKNARIELIAKDSELLLRWPSGDVSALIPMGQDEFVDRSYWEPVRVERDSSGHPSILVYDRYRGTSVGYN